MSVVKEPAKLAAALALPAGAFWRFRPRQTLQATGVVTDRDHWHAVTVSEDQGFARLSLSRADLRETQDCGLKLRVDTGIAEDYRHGEPLVMGHLIALQLSPETGALTATFK